MLKRLSLIAHRKLVCLGYKQAENFNNNVLTCFWVIQESPSWERVVRGKYTRLQGDLITFWFNVIICLFLVVQSSDVINQKKMKLTYRQTYYLSKYKFLFVLLIIIELLRYYQQSYIFCQFSIYIFCVIGIRYIIG